MRTRETPIKTIPLTEARFRLGALVKRVHLNKEYVVLQKDGISSPA